MMSEEIGPQRHVAFADPELEGALQLNAAKQTIT